MPQPLTLKSIRDGEDIIRETRKALSERYKDALYFPFELSSKRDLRPAQGYLTKLPKAVVDAFAVLKTAAASLENLSESAAPAVLSEFGAAYRPANEQALSSVRDPFAVDPALVERGVRGHANVQNRLADVVRQHGFEPRSPQPQEPNFDLAWVAGDTTFVAEVKSITDRNEEKQMRLGLGQVLRFRHILSTSTPGVIAVLAVERRPRDTSWETLCAVLGVRLVWPETLGEALS